MTPDDLIHRLQAADPAPRVLPDLVDHDAVLQQVTSEPREARRMRRSLRRRILLTFASLVAVGGAGGVALAATGGSLPLLSDHPSGGRVQPASVRLLPLRVADPAGGAPWGLRVYRTSRGYGCLDLGRVVGGRLGGYGADGRFRELPVGIAACAGPATRQPIASTSDRIGLTSDGLQAAGGAQVPGARPACSAYNTASAIPALIRQAPARLRHASSAATRARLRRQLAEASRAQRDALPRCPADQIRTVAYGVPGTTASAYLVVLPGEVPLARLRALSPCARLDGRLVAAVTGRCER